MLTQSQLFEVLWCAKIGVACLVWLTIMSVVRWARS